MIKKITEKESEDIFFEKSKKYTLREDEGWEDEGKVSYGSKIFVDDHDFFWRLTCSRSGSYFSHYEYEFETELTQVKQVEIVKKEWQPVKD